MNTEVFKNAKDIKGIVFDMDGTLIDSLMVWDVLWSKAGEKFLGNPDFRPESKGDKFVRTSTLKDAINHIYSVYNIAGSSEELLEFANAVIFNFYKNDVMLKKGVLEFLEYCYKKGIKMCVASATATDLIKVAVKHCNIGKYFIDILSCADIGKGKDQPDIYLLAMERLGTKPEETCIFEDSHIAINTAYNIGMNTVGIYDKYNFGHEEMKKLSNVYIDGGETMEKLIEK